MTKRKLTHAMYRDFLQLTKDFLNIFALNIDCGNTVGSPRLGGIIEYPQSTFCIKNKKKKNLYTPLYPSFTLYNWGSGGICNMGTFS